jgi:hypothetical protein
MFYEKIGNQYVKIDKNTEGVIYYFKLLPLSVF